QDCSATPTLLEMPASWSHKRSDRFATHDFSVLTSMRESQGAAQKREFSLPEAASSEGRAMFQQSAIDRENDQRIPLLGGASAEGAGVGCPLQVTLPGCLRQLQGRGSSWTRTSNKHSGKSPKKADRYSVR